MTFDERLDNSIRIGKLYLDDYLASIIEAQSNGNNIKPMRLTYIILNEWVGILQRYLSQNYNQDGTVIDGANSSLTQDQASAVMNKITAAVGNNTYPPNRWILATGAFLISIGGLSTYWDNSAVYQCSPWDGI